MLKKKIALTKKVASDIRRFEEAVDNAIILGSETLRNAIAGRLEANLATQVGHEGIAHLVKSIQDLAEARAEVIKGHDAFLETAKELKTEFYAGGDWWKIDPNLASGENDDVEGEPTVTGTDG
jgi:hypothetical protein